MSPSPSSGPTASTGFIAAKSKSPTEKKVNLQDDDPFSWIEKPFGQEQYVEKIIKHGLAHICGLYYCYVYLVDKQVNRTSILFEIFYAMLGGLGTTVGCHRYWTHRTFKANLPLQVLLMMLHTITFQHPIYRWCRDHRIHHKYTDTDADPHNSKRGFWFSHIGWLLLPKTKELTEKLETYETLDLKNDPVVRFQARWYFLLVAVFSYLIPISVYYYIFKMPLLYCFLANCRGFLLNYHLTACVNSVAHLWGDKPYDKTICPVDNKILALLTGGGGWHNYHHTFPRDYRSSEFGWKLNYSTAVIDFFAWIGWAWDLKTVPESKIRERIQKTGDGSRVASNNHLKNLN